MSYISKKSIPRLLIIILITTCLVLFLSGCKKSEPQTKDEDILEEIELSEETQNRIEKAKERGNPALVISNVEAVNGDTAIVTVSLVNNPGIIGLSMTLSCDESILTLEKVINGDVFGDNYDMVYTEGVSNGCSFLWDTTDISEDEIRDGAILALEFKVKENAPPGKTPVILLCDHEGAYDSEIGIVDLDIQNGFVIVKQ